MAASDVTQKGRKRKIEEERKEGGGIQRKRWKEKQYSLIIVAHIDNV